MRIRGRLLKVPLACLVAFGLAVLIVLGMDRVLPFVHEIPLYTPMLSTMGVPNAPVRTVSCDFDCTAHNNSLGLRGPEISLSISSKFRIAVLGSSYTYGYGVNDDQCFVRLLERGLRERGIDAEIVNLGRNGGYAAQYALLAEEALPLLKPNLVIVALIQGCDLEWSGPMLRQEWLSHAIWSVLPNLSSLIGSRGRPPLGKGSIEGVPEPTDADAAFIKAGAVRMAHDIYEQLIPERRVRFDGLEKRIKDLFFAGEMNPGTMLLSMNSPDMHTLTLDLDSEHTKTRIRYLGNYLKSIARTGKSVGCPTLVMSVPYGVYVNEAAVRSEERLGFHVVEGMLSTMAPDEGMRRACGELPFFSATEAFRRQASDDKLFYEVDLHMAPQGHALFAREILPWVVEHVRHGKKK